MSKKHLVSRRTTLKGIGAAGASAVLGASTGYSQTGDSNPTEPPVPGSDMRRKIFEKVTATPLIDTHEHLIEENERLSGKSPRIHCDDWSFVLSHYLNSDMTAATMPADSYKQFFSDEVEPAKKWKLLEPYWPAIRHTGYGQAVTIAIRQLYGVDDLSAATVEKVQDQYQQVRKPGFYKRILQDMANIESCQVNCLYKPFEQSAMPTLLMQDLSILGMLQGPDFDQYAPPTGIKVKTLSDWHRVIDWWFEKYADYAVAVKSQNAYGRDIDYEQVRPEKAEPVFRKRLDRHSLTPPEQKALEDHLFWYAVKKATENNLPVKLHTGYYAGINYMPLGRLAKNPDSATDLCRMAPDTRFVFMHICYPYYEEMIAVAKAYANAYIDMCWSWIINPVAAKDFLKKYLVTAPANKILTFGGDYIPVEPVLGHAVIARRGIALALAELVEEQHLSLDDALKLTDAIMHENARRIFNLDEKMKNLRQAPWA
ncbi:MAG: amidohydrolase family protein [Sedimentisphaerales bacterium]|nr:amidohydrolase family protein [Sedimentisphaerales bacterium]